MALGVARGARNSGSAALRDRHRPCRSTPVILCTDGPTRRPARFLPARSQKSARPRSATALGVCPAAGDVPLGAGQAVLGSPGFLKGLGIRALDLDARGLCCKSARRWQLRPCTLALSGLGRRPPTVSRGRGLVGSRAEAGRLRLPAPFRSCGRDCGPASCWCWPDGASVPACGARQGGRFRGRPRREQPRKRDNRRPDAVTRTEPGVPATLTRSSGRSPQHWGGGATQRCGHRDVRAQCLPSPFRRASPRSGLSPLHSSTCLPGTERPRHPLPDLPSWPEPHFPHRPPLVPALPHFWTFARPAASPARLPLLGRPGCQRTQTRMWRTTEGEHG